jgi:hypothetical protein
MNRIRKRTFVLCVAVAAGAGGTALAGCEDIPDPGVINCRSLAEFTTVSPVLEQRCGTLDCHGNMARPLRIYSKNGLRYTRQPFDPAASQDAGAVAGGAQTSDVEIELNWRSVCGLEPEKMNALVAAEIEPEALMLLDKPLGKNDPSEESRHKGGKLYVRGDVAWSCIRSWLAGAVNVADCDSATQSD